MRFRDDRARWKEKRQKINKWHISLITRTTTGFFSRVISFDFKISLSLTAETLYQCSRIDNASRVATARPRFNRKIYGWALREFLEIVRWKRGDNRDQKPNASLINFILIGHSLHIKLLQSFLHEFFFCIFSFFRCIINQKTLFSY